MVPQEIGIPDQFYLIYFWLIKSCSQTSMFREILEGSTLTLEKKSSRVNNYRGMNMYEYEQKL